MGTIDEQEPFTSEIVGSILAVDDVKTVSQRSAESRGFSPGTPVSYRETDSTFRAKVLRRELVWN